MPGPGSVKGLHGGDQPGYIVALLIAGAGAEGLPDLLSHPVDGMVDDGRPEGHLRPEPVMDEGVPHAQALVELPYGDRLVAQLGERFQPSLEHLPMLGHRNASGRPTRSPASQRACHESLNVVMIFSTLIWQLPDLG